MADSTSADAAQREAELTRKIDEAYRPGGPLGAAMNEKGADAGEPADEAEDEPTLYTYQPDLLPQHALLGSLIHAPGALNDLEKFLGPRDFSDPSLRAIYTTIRGLANTGDLRDVITVEGEGNRKDAANDNFRAVFEALRDQRFTDAVVPNVSKVIAQLNAAAPVDTLPYRGVYDPGAQMRLGRMVLEDSVRRHVESLGVHMVRPTALTRPPFARGRSGGTAEDMRANLTTVAASLDRLAVRLARAVERTGPAEQSGVDPARVAQAAATPYRPSPLRALTAPLVHRAERHLIHLALHSGTGLDLDLTPQDFSSPRHANTWAAIQRIQQRGDPVSYVAVFEELRPNGRGADNQQRPVLSDKQLTSIFNSEPNKDEAKIGRSLRTVVDASLKRQSATARNAVQAAARHLDVDPQALIDHAQTEVSKLSRRADTASKQHKKATDMLSQRGTTR